MLDDIGKAEPHMATAVLQWCRYVWNDYGIYGEGISIAIVDTLTMHMLTNDFDDNGFTNDLKVAAYYDAGQDAIICSENGLSGTSLVSPVNL